MSRLTLPIRIAKGPERQGLSSVFAAAVVNHQFRELLLRDAKAAIQTGYQGQKFNLTNEERALLLSVSAKSLPDFARKVTRGVDEWQNHR